METEEQREFWAGVEQSAREVDQWPAWLRGVDEPVHLNIGKWPDCKSVSLYIQKGSEASILAWFVSEDAAEIFMACAKKGVVWKKEDKEA